MVCDSEPSGLMVVVTIDVLLGFIAAFLDDWVNSWRSVAISSRVFWPVGERLGWASGISFAVGVSLERACARLSLRLRGPSEAIVEEAVNNRLTT